MAKTEVQAQLVADRLRQFLKLEDRFNHLDRTRRPNAAWMKKQAFKHHSEARLRQLRAEIDSAADAGLVPRIIHLIKRTILSSLRYSGYLAPSRAAHLWRLEHFAGLADQGQHDLNRFGMTIADAYGLATVEAAEDPQWADCFGPCDDPDRAISEMDDLKSRMNEIMEGCRTGYTGADAEYRETALADGRRAPVGYYKGTDGTVPLGAAQSLVDWAKSHRAELGV